MHLQYVLWAFISSPSTAIKTNLLFLRTYHRNNLQLIRKQIIIYTKLLDFILPFVIK
jgi:hypothetical protein